MFQAVNNDRIRLGKFLPWVPFTQTEMDSLKWIQSTRQWWDEGILFDYGIFLKESNCYLGNIGVHEIKWEFDRCEIGYWISGEHEGQGYMSEALRTLEKHLFDMGFHRIEVRCSSRNERSANVPKACGYKLDGILREDSIEHEQYRSTLVFSKLATDQL